MRYQDVISIDQSARLVCQFSCGAASAVATKLVLARYGSTADVQIINAFIKEEHPDNRRFLTDCERWFGRQITVLRDEKYGASVIEVFRRKQFIVSRRGAPCSTALKRTLLDSWKRPNDVMILGFTSEEQDRFDDICERNPDRTILAPLIDEELSKSDCKAMIKRAGIELPLMYRLGYDNANCPACVKGGEGYFRAIRADFPEWFENLAAVQESIGPGANFLRYRSGPKKNQRFSLRDLPQGKPRRNEKVPDCSFSCELAELLYGS